MLIRAGVLSCAVKCNNVPVKLRGCTLPDVVPTTLNADSVVNIIAGVAIFVNPSLVTLNASMPDMPLVTLMGRLNTTLPVADAIPITMSRVGSLILIVLSCSVNCPTVKPAPPAITKSPPIAVNRKSIPSVSSCT